SRDPRGSSGPILQRYSHPAHGDRDLRGSRSPSNPGSARAQSSDSVEPAALERGRPYLMVRILSPFTPSFEQTFPVTSASLLANADRSGASFWCIGSRITT